MRVAIFVFMLLSFPLSALADDAIVEEIQIVDTGIYTVEAGEKTPDASTPTGEVTAVSTAKLVEATTAIKARPGLEFGLRYIVIGEPQGAEVQLDIVIHYPSRGLREPGSAEPVFDSRFSRTKAIGKTEYLGYGFEKDWEVVPGRWSFEIWHEGNKLAEQAFTVKK